MLILSQEVWKTAYVASVPGVQGRSLLVEGHTISNKEPRTHRGWAGSWGSHLQPLPEVLFARPASVPGAWLLSVLCVAAQVRALKIPVSRGIQGSPTPGLEPRHGPWLSSSGAKGGSCAG